MSKDGVCPPQPACLLGPDRGCISQPHGGRAANRTEVMGCSEHQLALCKPVKTKQNKTFLQLPQIITKNIFFFFLVLNNAD